MAEAESKSGVDEDSAKSADEVKTSNNPDEKLPESKDATTKSSWSGWFQKMNDAVLGAPSDEADGVENAGESNDGGWSAWGNSLLRQAKEKTLTTFELVKKDLTEFSDVVQNETAGIVSVTASTIRERAPQLVGGLVGSVNTLLVDDTTRGEEENEIPVTAATIVNRSEARLYAIQSDPGTYCNEPEGAPELFDDWLDHVFHLEDKRDEISHLLVNNPTVRNLFAQLVPSQVSNTTFWQRYFYKVHQFELDEARRRALLQREEAANIRSSSDNQKLSWGDESEPEERVSPAENAEMVTSFDMVNVEGVPVSSSEHHDISDRQQPPEGVSAIRKSSTGEKQESFHVETKAAEETKKKLSVHTTDTDFSSISSLGTPPRNGAESPTDKKSDDWVEWEGNGDDS